MPTPGFRSPHVGRDEVSRNGSEAAERGAIKGRTRYARGRCWKDLNPHLYAWLHSKENLQSIRSEEYRLEHRKNSFSRSKATGFPKGVVPKMPEKHWYYIRNLRSYENFTSDPVITKELLTVLFHSNWRDAILPILFMSNFPIKNHPDPFNALLNISMWIHHLFTSRYLRSSPKITG